MALCNSCDWPKWPVTRKCCFCIPIRRGVIIFAYANLVFNLLSLPILIFLLVDHVVYDKSMLKSIEETKDTTDIGTEDQIAVHACTIAFMCIDVILIILLLVGVHKKNKRLLQVYFYLGVGFQLITLCLDITISLSFQYDQLEENLLYLFFLCLNIYQLFLVYNTIHIIEANKEIQYVVYQEQGLR